MAKDISGSENFHYNNIEKKDKNFICVVCGYVHEGDTPPEVCPICKAPASKFKELTLK